MLTPIIKLTHNPLKITKNTNINTNPFEDERISDNDSDKFLKELQKTFGSLSALLSN